MSVSTRRMSSLSAQSVAWSEPSGEYAPLPLSIRRGQVDLASFDSSRLTANLERQQKSLPSLARRAFDVAASLGMLIALAPLLALTALAIVLESRGPIFYRQNRVGLNGGVFQIFKFRSMRVDAEATGPQWARVDDDRITRVGRFIRKLRIDEIPQALNILAGDMSFVGPRPERPEFVQQLVREIPHYDLRHLVKPGLTGWAQVMFEYGASVEDAREKTAFDLHYLERRSLWLDLFISFRTIKVALFGLGAR